MNSFYGVVIKKIIIETSHYPWNQLLALAAHFNRAEKNENGTQYVRIVTVTTLYLQWN